MSDTIRPSTQAWQDDAPGQALQRVEPVGSLPDIAAMRENMRLQQARRELLADYVAQYMDKARHFYDPRDLGMGGQEGKLRLNQDGARNLRGLYEVYAGEPVLEEVVADGHLDVKVKIPIISHGTGHIVAWGLGFCSTRESKYAYRWVAERAVPAGMNKRDLRSQTGQRGTRYRIPNEDLPDQYHTVRMMARKRAEVAGTMELPGVTELFAPPEAAEEDVVESQEAQERSRIKQALWRYVSAMPAPRRTPVLQKLFNHTVEELRDLPTEELESYLLILEEFQAAGIAWDSETLLEDLRQMMGTRGQAARDALFPPAPSRTQTRRPAPGPGTPIPPELPDEGWRDELRRLWPQLSPAWVQTYGGEARHPQTPPGRGAMLVRSAALDIVEQTPADLDATDT